CPPTARSAPVTASGSATPANPSSTSPPARKSPPQHRANRLLRRYTPQGLMLACQTAARAIPPWPPSPAAIPLHWRHPLLTLQTANPRYGTPTDHDAYTHAAIYPDAIALAALAMTASFGPTQTA